MNKRKGLFRVLILLLAFLLAVPPVQVSAVEPLHGAQCTFCKDCNRIVTFKNPLHRIYGNTRYETCFAIADTLKEHYGGEAFPYIVVASGAGFADALAGSFLANAAGAPILLTNGKNQKDVCNYIKNNLAPGGKVYLLGGTAVVPASMEKGLEGIRVERLWGADRYATNLAILNEVGVGAEPIVICTGKNFADSLSASALGMPILLVGDKLTEEQKEFLSSRMGDRYIIGGTGAVSAAVEKQIRDVSWHTVEIHRIGGSNRYETSVLVAKAFFTDPTVLVTAYGGNFPDGLCGGPLAYSIGSPMILTATGKEAQAAAYAHGNHACWGYVLGGKKLISDAAAKKIYVARNDNQGGDYENYDYYMSEDWLFQPFVPGDDPLSVEPLTAALLKGSTYQLSYSYSGDLWNLTWSTSDPDAVLVGPGGLIYTVAAGTAVIRATDGKDTVYCEVTVVDQHTPAQKEEYARRMAQSIADGIMNDPTLKTDLERIAKAAAVINDYVARGHYSTVHPDYNTAYGTLIAGFSSCAGSTRAMGLVLECMGFEWSHVNENQWDHQWCIVYDMDGKVGFADGSTYGLAGYGSREDDTWYVYRAGEGLVAFREP